mgnify:CR=1 FL=1
MALDWCCESCVGSLFEKVFRLADETMFCIRRLLKGSDSYKATLYRQGAREVPRWEDDVARWMEMGRKL